MTDDSRAELFGLGGDDILVSGAGDDLLYGGPGADTMRGGAGSDGFFVDDADTIIGGEDFDYVRADESRGAAALHFTITDQEIEFVWGGRGDDVIDTSRAAETYSG